MRRVERAVWGVFALIAAAAATWGFSSGALPEAWISMAIGVGCSVPLMRSVLSPSADQGR